MTYRIHEHMPLAPLSTFRIGGPARWLVSVGSTEELKRALRFAQAQEVSYTLLAGGSNVLIADAGVPGIVIHLENGRFRIAGEYVYVEAGVPLEGLIREMANRGLGGFESLVGIPGSVGGAVRGNAGAFGTEIKDVVTEVRALDTRTGTFFDFCNNACEFSYRDSVFKHEPQWIITHVVLKLHKMDTGTLERTIATTITERERRHLQRVRAAGSFFKNPQAPPAVRALFEYEKQTRCVGRRVPAGWLIEKVGAKGASVGGALASEQHPNYLLNNTGDATANDVLELARQIHEKVLERYNISLEPEVSFLGFRE